MVLKRLFPYLLLAGLAVALEVATTVPAWTEDNNGVQQDGEGMYANLSALWWQWVWSIPAVDVGEGEDATNTNPVLDKTGEFAAAGQENGQGPANKFFFLCGSFGFPVERMVTVPHGKALFFPIVNWEYDNAVEPPTNYTVPRLRAIIDAVFDTVDPATQIVATLNGEPLEVFRTKSPVFSYTVPDENSLYDYFGQFGPQFEGTIKPAVSDGFWCYVAPLPPGEYLLVFTCPDFNQDNTYYLTVE